MEDQRKNLINRFDKWIDSDSRKQIISAVCANIAEEYAEEQLDAQRVDQQREFLEWLSNEDYFNIPKDEISEILDDWGTYNSSCI